MSQAIARFWDEEVATREVAGVFQEALAHGPQVVRLRDGRELVVSEREPAPRPRMTPQEYVRRNKLGRPAPDPFDEAQEQARAEVGDALGFNR